MSRAGTDGRAATRFEGWILGTAGADGSAARRFGGRVLGKTGADGTAARRFVGRVLGKAGVDGSAARRLGGRDLDRDQGNNDVVYAVRTSGVHTGSVAMEATEIAVSEGTGREGDGGAGVKGNEPTQGNVRYGRLGRSVITCSNEANPHGVGAGKAVRSSLVEVGGRLWKVGEEIGTAIDRAFTVILGVRVGG